MSNEDDLPELPPSPTRWLDRTYLATGAATLGLSAGLVSAGGVTLPVIVAAAGAVHLGLGLHGLRSAPSRQLLAMAADLLDQGRHEDARRLARAAGRRGREARRAALVFEAEIDADLGAGEPALARAEEAEAIGAAFWERGPAVRDRLGAASLVALCRARVGDVEGARRAIARMRELALAPEAVRAEVDSGRRWEAASARGALAEAIVLDLEGDRGGLAAHLAQHEGLLEGGLRPSDRAALVGLQERAADDRASPYRRPDGPRPSAAEAAIPSASPSRAAPPAASTDLGAGDLARVGRTSRRDWSSLRRVSGLVAAWIAAALLAFGANFLPVDPSTRSPLFVTTMLVPIVFMLGILVFAAERSLRARRQAAELLALLHRSGERRSGERRSGEGGQEREAGLTAFADAPEALRAAQACLELARGANARGRFAEARATAEKGLSRLQGALHRAVASSDLLPALAAERAFADGALGDVAPALREMDALPATFAERTRAAFSVRLVALARGSHDAEAEALARSRPATLPLAPRVAALSDLLLATAEATDRGAIERRRLWRALRRDEGLRAWLAQIAPERVARLDAPARVRVVTPAREVAPVGDDVAVEDVAVEGVAVEGVAELEAAAALEAEPPAAPLRRV